MFAIKQALMFIKSNKNICANVVIFTDSLSSVFLLLDRLPSTYLFIVYKIQEIIRNLLPDNCVRIQYVPGHKGIAGNEVADGAAKEAHCNVELERAQVAREEMVRTCSIGLRDRWQSEWTNRVNVSGKGRHLMLVRDEIGIWPWSSNKVRVIDTAMDTDTVIDT